MRGVSAAGGEVSREKQMWKKGERQEGAPGDDLFSSEQFQCVKSGLVALKICPCCLASIPLLPSVLGSAGVSLGILFPKHMRESPAKFCTPQTLPDLMLRPC